MGKFVLAGLFGAMVGCVGGPTEEERATGAIVECWTECATDEATGESLCADVCEDDASAGLDDGTAQYEAGGSRQKQCTKLPPFGGLKCGEFRLRADGASCKDCWWTDSCGNIHLDTICYSPAQ